MMNQTDFTNFPFIILMFNLFPGEYTARDKVVRHSRGSRPCKNGSWETSLLRENFAETDQPPSEKPIFNQYLLVEPQP